MKPTEKAALGAVSESAGRNESEPTGGLDTNNPKAEFFRSGRRQHDISQTDRRGMPLAATAPALDPTRSRHRADIWMFNIAYPAPDQ